MDIVCLDLEGTLFPEIWIAVAEKTGIKELRRTTREEPDYGKLMRQRIEILKEHGITLKDIQDVIATIEPLEGAVEFVQKVRETTQLVILSDTFDQFAKPVMRKFGFPTILCNTLEIDADGMVCGFRMRQTDPKRRAIEGFRSMGFRTFAAGDSYNDLNMVKCADAGCLFRAPANILEEYPQIKLCTEYSEFFEEIEKFLKG